jgi:hypothetical protein
MLEAASAAYSAAVATYSRKIFTALAPGIHLFPLLELGLFIF